MVALHSCSGSTTSANATSCTNTYGVNTVTDCRDGQTYKTVVIGTQTWMAQNLNFKPTKTPDSSWCYRNSISNCANYGRLYDFPTAWKNCPTGWHLPDTAAWNTLEAYVSDSATAGAKLKAVSPLWMADSGITNTDDYGFSALPGGSSSDTSFGGDSKYGVWWTATTDEISYAYVRYLYYDNASMSHHYESNQASGNSVRCIKDTP